MYKMRGRGGGKGRGKLTEREEERGRERLDAFSTLLHFSLAPRGFSKAFSKNTSGCVVDQTAAAATSQPTQQTVPLIFQSLSVSVLCLFYTYFWSSLHPPAHSCSHHPSSSFTFKPRPQLIYHHQLSLSFVSQFVQLSSPKTDVNCLLCSLLRCQFKVDETFAVIITANPVCRRHCWFSLLLLSVFEEVASSHFSTSFLRHVN